MTPVSTTDEVLVQLVRRGADQTRAMSLVLGGFRAPADVAQSLVDGLTTISNLPEEAKLGRPIRAPGTRTGTRTRIRAQQEEIRERDQIAQLTKVAAKLVDLQIPDEDEPDEPGE